jgi:hypothetical protein
MVALVPALGQNHSPLGKKASSSQANCPTWGPSMSICPRISAPPLPLRRRGETFGSAALVPALGKDCGHLVEEGFLIAGELPHSVAINVDLPQDLGAVSDQDDEF